MSTPTDEALHVIQSRSEGVLQSELWKCLNVDSRKCSRIVKKLLDSGLIDRMEFKQNGIKTFVLRVRKRPVDPCYIMAGDVLVPCIACEKECMVQECGDLIDWMYQLAFSEEEPA